VCDANAIVLLRLKIKLVVALRIFPINWLWLEKKEKFPNLEPLISVHISQVSALLSSESQTSTDADFWYSVL
jgi:hypothetical protein